jgi:hypothetical protein
MSWWNIEALFKNKTCLGSVLSLNGKTVQNDRSTDEKRALQTPVTWAKDEQMEREKRMNYSSSYPRRCRRRHDDDDDENL